MGDLFQRLVNCEANSNENVWAHEHDAEDITSHLTSLLNARRGKLSHLSHYGMDDPLAMMEKLPEALPKLEKDIVDTMERYEKRCRVLNCHSRLVLDDYPVCEVLLNCAAVVSCYSQDFVPLQQNTYCFQVLLHHDGRFRVNLVS